MISSNNRIAITIISSGFVLLRSSFHAHEELVLNVVAAVTNLLFYDVPSNMLFQDLAFRLYPSRLGFLYLVLQYPTFSTLFMGSYGLVVT